MIPDIDYASLQQKARSRFGFSPDSMSDDNPFLKSIDSLVYGAVQDYLSFNITVAPNMNPNESGGVQRQKTNDYAQDMANNLQQSFSSSSSDTESDLFFPRNSQNDTILVNNYAVLQQKIRSRFGFSPSSMSVDNPFLESIDSVVSETFQSLLPYLRPQFKNLAVAPSMDPNADGVHSPNSSTQSSSDSSSDAFIEKALTNPEILDSVNLYSMNVPFQRKVTESRNKKRMRYRHEMLCYLHGYLACMPDPTMPLDPRFMPDKPPIHLIEFLLKAAEKRDLKTFEALFLILAGFENELVLSDAKATSLLALVPEGSTELRLPVNTPTIPSLVLTASDQPLLGFEIHVKRENTPNDSRNRKKTSKGQYPSLKFEQHEYLKTKKYEIKIESKDTAQLILQQRIYILNLEEFPWFEGQPYCLTHFRFVGDEAKNYFFGSNGDGGKDNDNHDNEKEDDDEEDENDEDSKEDKCTKKPVSSRKRKQGSKNAKDSKKKHQKTTQDRVHGTVVLKYLFPVSQWNLHHPTKEQKIFFGRESINRLVFRKKMKDLIGIQITDSLFNLSEFKPIIYDIERDQLKFQNLPEEVSLRLENINYILQSYSLPSYPFHDAFAEIQEDRKKYQQSVLLDNDDPNHPSAIMRKLFPLDMNPTPTKEVIMEDFKVFCKVYMEIFPEFLFNLEISEDEMTPEADPLDPNSLIFEIIPSLSPSDTKKHYQETNKAVMKLLYAYHMIRDKEGKYNHFFDISDEHYGGLIALFHFIYASDEEKLLFLYALGMNDLGKSTPIIQALQAHGKLPENVYIDHDEKFYSFLVTLGSLPYSSSSSGSFMLQGWNTIHFSTEGRQLMLESQSTSINFPQLIQGEMLQLCLKKFVRLSKYAQFFRLILQIIDMAGAKSNPITRKALILKNENYHHWIVAMNLLFEAGEEAYGKYFEVIFREDFERLQQTTTIDDVDLQPKPFLYARTAALLRFNKHLPEDMLNIHDAWRLFREKDATKCDLLVKEFLLTGCGKEKGETEIGILIYFAPGIMQTCFDNCCSLFSDKEKPSKEAKVKGIFYGLQILEFIYRISREEYSSKKQRQEGVSVDEDEAYLNVNAARFFKYIKDKLATFIVLNGVFKVLEEDVDVFQKQFENEKEAEEKKKMEKSIKGDQYEILQCILYSFVKYLVNQQAVGVTVVPPADGDDHHQKDGHEEKSVMMAMRSSYFNCITLIESKSS